MLRPESWDCCILLCNNCVGVYSCKGTNKNAQQYCTNVRTDTADSYSQSLQGAPPVKYLHFAHGAQIYESSCLYALNTWFLCHWCKLLETLFKICATMQPS